MQCPVCDLSWPDEKSSCSCGYDFTTRNPELAIRRLQTQARRGNNLWRRGLAAMIALPVTFAIPSVVLAWLLAMVQLGFAAIWIVSGLARADRANRKLEAAKQLVQLPAARVIER